MNKLTLKLKIYCLIGLFVLSFAATTLLLLRELSRQATQDYTFAVLQLSTQNSARVIQLNFKKQVQAWKDILLRGSDPASFQKYRDEFLKEEAEVSDGAKALAEQVSDPDGKTEIKTFIDSHQKLSGDYRTALQVFEKSRGSNFHAVDSMVKGKDRPVTDAVDRIVADLNARTQHSQEENRQHFETKLRSMGLSTLAAAAVLFLLGTYIARTINRSTRELLCFLNSQVGELSAGRADLTKRLTSTSHDEFGEIADTFNAYTQALEKIVSKLSQCIEQIASASEEISSGASQSAENAQQQADQANQVATAMEEMSTTVQEVAANSQKASDSALQAAQAARHGGEVVKQTVSTMSGIADASRSAAERVTSLGQASGKIGKIVAVIDDIADQTNLLALNAAIEAARAGESGRGFAVVADEVRKLAERTTAATKEIATMVQGIQDGTMGSVEAIELGSRQAQAGLEEASASGAALEEIIHLATDVGDLISHIATAATEQSAATAQVNSSISRISSLTQNSSVAAQETAKACTDLSQLALELDNLIQGFKHNEMTNQSSRGVPSLPLKRPPSRIDQFTGNKASRAAAGVLT